MDTDNIAINGFENIIEIRDVRFKYSGTDTTVLNIDTLDIIKGQRIAVIGPSGAGKTTLFRMINGYIRPDSGYIRILDYNYKKNSFLPRNVSKKIGFIFQEFNLVDRATVFQNVLWGRLGMVNPLLSVLGVFSGKDKQLALRAIEDVNLLEYKDKRADRLSGGQKQRVAIARVLAQEARIILADEPISNLDPSMAEEILVLLSELCKKYCVTLLMNLHQPYLAELFADRIIGIKGGRVVFDGRPEAIDKAVMNNIFDTKTLKSVKETKLNESSQSELKVL